MKKHNFVVGEVAMSYTAAQIISSRIKDIADVWHEAYLNYGCSESERMRKLATRITAAAVMEADKECGLFFEAFGKLLQGKKVSRFEKETIECYTDITLGRDEEEWEYEE